MDEKPIHIHTKNVMNFCSYKFYWNFAYEVKNRIYQSQIKKSLVYFEISTSARYKKVLQEV